MLFLVTQGSRLREVPHTGSQSFHQKWLMSFPFPSYWPKWVTWSPWFHWDGEIRPTMWLKEVGTWQGNEWPFEACACLCPWWNANILGTRSPHCTSTSINNLMWLLYPVFLENKSWCNQKKYPWRPEETVSDSAPEKRKVNLGGERQWFLRLSSLLSLSS